MIKINKVSNFNIEKTTAEILMLKEQTAQNIIEIGKRLIEVKENLEHGEYLKWLESGVDFTERTAQRFVRVALAFSNTTSVSHLGNRKLFALAGLEEEERQEVMQENNVEDMTTRQVEQLIKEKKEIKKKLELEQEYKNQLQDTIKEKEQQILQLQNDIENIQKPEIRIVEKEVIKNIVPEELIQEKQSLEEELEQLRKRADKAENTLKNIRLEDNLGKDKVFDTAKLDMLLENMKEFLNKNSKYTYLKQDFQDIPIKKKKFIEQGVNSIKEWAMLMEQALENRTDMVGNIIYGKGEIINE